MLHSDGRSPLGEMYKKKKPFRVFPIEPCEVVLNLILLVASVRLVLNGQTVALFIGADDLNGDVNTPVGCDHTLDIN